MSKEVLFIALNIDVEINQSELESTVELFDKTLTGLISGNSYLGLVGTKNADIQAKLKEVANLWKPFQTQVKSALDGKVSADVLTAINQQNIPLLKKMNEAVKAYAVEGGSVFEPKLAHIIDQAGRQRMLIQKMTKELLLVAKGIDVEANKTSLANTVAEFEQALVKLAANKINESIAAQLTKVQKKWNKYKPILSSVDVSEPTLHKVDKLSESLYKAMNKAVQLYANSVAN